VSGVALSLVLVAAVCHAIWNITAHRVSRLGVPFLWWSSVASTALWALAIPFAGGIGRASWQQFGVALLGTAALHVGYMLVLQRGYARGRLSTVYATARGSGPAIAVFAAILFLGEQPGPVALLGVAIIITAVATIGLLDRQTDTVPSDGAPTRSRVGRGSFSRTPPPRGFPTRSGVGWGLVTGVAIAGYTLWDAMVVRDWGVPPTTLMVSGTLVEAFVFTPFLRGRFPEVRSLPRTHWRHLLVYAVFAPLSYILVLTALTMAPVSLVAPVREVSVIIVSAFGAFALREGNLGWRAGTAITVVAGIALIAM